MSDEQRELPVKTTGVGELVRQPHGGALKRGGVNPGAGRPPSAIRADTRSDFDKVRHVAVRIAMSKAKGTKDADRLRAIELLGRFGLDEQINRADVAAALQGTIEDIRSFLTTIGTPEEQVLALLALVRPRWRGL